MKVRLLLEGIAVVALSLVLLFVVTPLLGATAEPPAPPAVAPAPAAEAPEESAESEDGLKPGTYEGIGRGFGGKVTVAITVGADGKIEDVKADGPDETAGIGSNAIDQLPGKIIEAQSVDVDVVTGATISSGAILDAAKSALEAAQ